MEQFGFILNSQVAQDIGIASSLLLPSEALWRYAASILQETQRSLISSVTPFSVLSQPTPAFLVYAGLYIVGLLILAMVVFRQRDF